MPVTGGRLGFRQADPDTHAKLSGPDLANRRSATVPDKTNRTGAAAVVVPR